MDTKTYIEQLKQEFHLSSATLKEIASAFETAMREGLAGRPSSLKMLPSFIGNPQGTEKGAVIAIDFGGTNVRVLEAELDGRGGLRVLQMKALPLVDPKGAYNYVAATADADQLFGFIAARLAEIVRPGVDYAMGHTFSFPCTQGGLNSASLIHWTKEFRTRGVEGQDIGQLMDKALAGAGLSRVRGVAIINDTVGTQLAAGYSRRHVDIASICGTGHNTCYLEPVHPLTGRPMIVNMESGNFDGVKQTRFDAELDRASERPGAQRLEKMVSGYYLGDIVRRILAEMAQTGLLPVSEKLGQRQALGGAALSRILADAGALPETAAVLAEAFGWSGLSAAQLQAVREVVRLVGERSARLVAATFGGTLLRIDAALEREHLVAIDGSLFEKLPGYQAWIQAAVDEFAAGRKGRVTAILAKDGSGIGAAIAAATAAAASKA